MGDSTCDSLCVICNDSLFAILLLLYCKRVGVGERYTREIARKITEKITVSDSTKDSRQ